MARPGSAGEHLLQAAYGSEERATRFYDDQVRHRLLPAMAEFIGRMEMMFLSTSDGNGECDSSLRAGPPGFLHVLDPAHVAYPEFRGNGVHASLGNISENPHVGILMIDFERDLIGLHVNGRARIVDDEVMRTLHPELPEEPLGGRRAERWVVVEVEEAYIHCRKNIPRMARVHERPGWETDDPARKGGDYFGAKAERAPKRESGEGSDAPAASPRSAATAEPTATPEPVAAPGSAEAPGSSWPDGELAGEIPVQRSIGRSRFPSTTHLLTGAATARPLRAAVRPVRAGRRIRWLSS